MLTILNITIIIISALIAIAFYTLTERKFIGYIQFRKGPNKPSIIAIIIPIADAGKLFSKEEKKIIPMNYKYYYWTPIIIIILSILLWPIFPHKNSIFIIKLRIIYFLCITRIIVYTTFLTGWRSNTKWSLLGALRGVAQRISYEVRISLILICFISHVSSININNIPREQFTWIIFLIIPLSLSWIIRIIAETHRTPFDFAEGESELVSGFNIEYKRSIFAIIFIAEYINIIIIRLITASVISKRWSRIELIIKTRLISIIFIFTRRALPRIRYDILINILWKKILPLRLIWIIIRISIILITKWYCAGLNG